MTIPFFITNQAIVNRISIVMVSPFGDANIGAAARAMKNFGFHDLRLVNPVQYKTAAAYSWAAGARDILDNATVYKTLDHALSDSTQAIGFTRRLGRSRRRHSSLNDAGPWMAKLARSGCVAMVFGQEDAGLSNEDIEKLDAIVSIPTSPELPSLNLSQAVLIACFEVHRQLRPESIEKISTAATLNFAPRREVDHILSMFSDTLDQLSYRNSDSKPLKTKILNQIKRLFGRGGLTHRDIRMFEGLLSRIQEKAIVGQK